jgi:hypothetical protein
MPRPEILETIAEEQSTYVIHLAFRDEDDEEVVPVSIKWTLTTLGGEVVNDRSEVAVAIPAADVDVLLYGPDLALLTHKDSFSWRLLTVVAKYNSSLGSSLPLHKAVRFRVRNLRLIAHTLEVSVFEGVSAAENVGVSLS